MSDPKTYLGIELGSTRIKAVTVNEKFTPVESGDFTWKSSFVNGIWTYDLAEVWKGLKAAISGIEHRDNITAMGISAMEHGYLAFDKDWNLLAPFRTWQNTITAQAAAELTELFNFNVPQRWSVAHLYQTILNKEEHLPRLAHLTTLSGYVHHMLTGENVLGVGDASGMFPIDPETNDYDREMVEKFNVLLKKHGMPFTMEEVFPKVLVAGEKAGVLTAEGEEKLDHLLKAGIPFAPPEGDASTGMTATNGIAPRTGNVSGGTSIFAMVVMEKKLSQVYEEIDIVATPSGKPVAMVHCNNCTSDTNAWVSLFSETAKLFGVDVPMGDVFTKLYQKSLEGDPDCGGVMVCNYLAGEGIPHLDAGRPLVARTPESKFNLANFFRSQLYSTMATLKIGMDILAGEHIAIDSMIAHGGLFKTPGVGQKYMAAVCNAPVTCMETAGEGGPYGMALLVAYMDGKAEGEKLEDYLNANVFCNAKGSTLAPVQEDIDGFNAYLKQYKALLEVERTAVEKL